MTSGVLHRVHLTSPGVLSLELALIFYRLPHSFLPSFPPIFLPACLPASRLQELLLWALSRGLHVLCDEIYANSKFG